jgi:hypothetical protein
MVRALSHVFFFNPGPVRRVPIPNRYAAKAKLCFCKNNKRRIIYNRAAIGLACAQATTMRIDIDPHKRPLKKLPHQEYELDPYYCT